MAHQRIINPLEVLDQPGCLHLRSKAMYVTGDFDPAHLDEVDSHQRNCWCNITQRRVGPDEGAADRSTCVAGRTCYEAR